MLKRIVNHMDCTSNLTMWRKKARSPEGSSYYSRWLRSAQSRKRVPSFAVAAARYEIVRAWRRMQKGANNEDGYLKNRPF